MNPFDHNFKSELVAQALTKRGRAAASASARASARIEAMRASDDPRVRAAASGTIPGMGRQADADKSKTSRILKPANL